MFLNRLSKKQDEELMLLISNGEERALTELYNRYSKPLVRYFYRMLWKDEQKAQDFLHDLFVKIIERPEAFNTTKKFSTWIYSVAHNMCKNEYRKQSYRNTLNGFPNEIFATDINADAKIDHDEFRRCLDLALQKWSEDDRSLFIFRNELDMSFSEIAMILNCPEGTAKSRWFYLRKALAEQLQDFHTIIK
jgi:RNA polymerase sigma-70 factor (ECF subfamily)